MEHNLNNKYTKKYSVLGGVIAPKRSAYSIQGMRNPNLEMPVKKIDTFEGGHSPILPKRFVI